MTESTPSGRTAALAAQYEREQKKRDQELHERLVRTMKALNDRTKVEQLRRMTSGGLEYDPIYNDAFCLLKELLMLATEGRMICDAIMGQYHSLDKHRRHCLAITTCGGHSYNFDAAQYAVEQERERIKGNAETEKK